MRKIFHRFFTIVAIVFVGLLLADVAKACSCVQSPTVDIAFAETPNVVIVKIDSLQTQKNPALGREEYYISKMSVQKVYKGNLVVGQELSFGISGFSCDYTFPKDSIGKEMLFYLDEKPSKSGFWYYPACTRSNWVKESVGDLNYLENINKVRGKTRISGVLWQEIRPALEGEEYTNKLLADTNIQIVGNGKNITLKTDKNGVYEIYDLPAGIYEIIPQQIDGYKLYSRGSMVDSEKILLQPNGHAEMNLKFNIFNSISGEILDEKGRAMEGVCVYLKPTEGEKARYLIKLDCSEADGKFEISGIPIGKYVLIVNEDGEITADEPFETFYYPNSAKKESAKIFSIEAGKKIDGIIIKPVPKVETVLIKGKVVFEDGVSPTKIRDEYASINFVPDNPNYDEKNKFRKSYDSSNLTDKNGEFSLRVYKGQKGKLYADIGSYVGLYENCPKLDKLVKSKGDSYHHIETNILTIDAEKDLENVILKFPFPSCKKSKRN